MQTAKRETGADGRLSLFLRSWPEEEISTLRPRGAASLYEQYGATFSDDREADQCGNASLRLVDCEVLLRVGSRHGYLK